MGAPSTIARWLRRGRRRLLVRPRVGFVYSRRYQLELPGATCDSRRGERILTFLDSAGLLASRAVHRPEPATFRHLRRVHSDEYLDSLRFVASCVRDGEERLPLAIVLGGGYGLNAWRYSAGHAAGHRGPARRLLRPPGARRPALRAGALPHGLPGEEVPPLPEPRGRGLPQ